MNYSINLGRGINIENINPDRWNYILHEAQNQIDQHRYIYFDSSKKRIGFYSSVEAPKGAIKLNLNDIVSINKTVLKQTDGSLSLQNFYSKIQDRTHDSFFSKLVNFFWRHVGFQSSREWIQAELKSIPQLALGTNLEENALLKKQTAIAIKNELIEELKEKGIVAKDIQPTCFEDLREAFSRWLEEEEDSTRLVGFKHVYNLFASQLGFKSKYDLITISTDIKIDKQRSDRKVNKEQISIENTILSVLKKMQPLIAVLNTYPEMKQTIFLQADTQQEQNNEEEETSVSSFL